MSKGDVPGEAQSSMPVVGPQEAWGSGFKQSTQRFQYLNFQCGSMSVSQQNTRTGSLLPVFSSQPVDKTQ